jgi:hypothetical protein
MNVESLKVRIVGSSGWMAELGGLAARTTARRQMKSVLNKHSESDDLGGCVRVR